MTTARDTIFSGDFGEVAQFYSELRRRLYKRASQKFSSFIATPISYRDCIQADSWAQEEPKRRNDWHWTAEHSGYQKAFKRFDIAFKQGQKLVSLSYGMPTAHSSGLKINLIESTPFKDDKLGFKGFELISYAAQVYAAMLGADEIRIMRPTSVKTRSYYEAQGYHYVSQVHKPSLPDYCVLKLR